MLLIISLFLVGCGNNITEDNVTEDMVLVEAGTTSEENGEIRVEEDFYIKKYEVTQTEFEEVMGFNPLLSKSKNHPVEMVTWYDAVNYCNKLSDKKRLDKYYQISDIEYRGDDAKERRHPKSIISATVEENEGANGYRLPTEDEWEYAARGGKNGDPTTYAGSNNLDKVGWYKDNSEHEKLEEFANKDLKEEDIIEFVDNNPMTRPVGEKKANELGIYDMSGNVWEWTNTPKGYFRVFCGGCLCNNANNCEVSSSRSYFPSCSYYNLGFRLTKTK